jgi:hypothetical protein
MTIDEANLTKLLADARQRGSVSLEDLRKELPIDSMAIEDISVVLARLDEAGFDLDIDPALLSSTHHAPPPHETTIPKPEQAGLPETETAPQKQPSTFPTATGGTIKKAPAARRSKAVLSPSMLPWILAFAIILLAVFAAFAS